MEAEESAVRGASERPFSLPLVGDAAGGVIDLAAILPIEAVQALLDQFNRVFPVVTAILDLSGRILQASGWQRICTDFHRANAESCRNCTESDLYLAGNVRPGEFVAYRCKNQLWDVVTPLVIGGVHCGNLYTGQFLFTDDVVDEEAYAAQADRYGFDRASYLAALAEVPRIQRERLDEVMRFLVRLTSLVSDLGVSNLRLQAEIAERRRLYEALQGEQESRMRLERGLMQAQKNESLGVLAGGIAHDFNNLLMAISGNLELARLDSQEGSDQAASLDDAASATRRAAELTRQMLAYSGRGGFVVEAVDLGALLEQSSELLRSSVSRSITLVVERRREGAVVEADRTQLRQLLTNLLLNAAEAIGEGGGTIRLRTGSEDATAEVLVESRLGEAPAPGRFAFLEVADTGCGLTEATLARAFEPFFTTKATGRGLGLSALHGVVKSLGGAVLVESEVGRGATFRVLFPASAASPVSTRRPARPSAPRPATGRLVLVVDDERPVRASLSRMLKRLGHAVVEAVDGPSALALVASAAAPIDCAIIDLTMPGMDGLSLQRELARVAPSIATIMTSGYDLEPASSRAQPPSAAGFLGKPYSVAELDAVVARALAGR